MPLFSLRALWLRARRSATSMPSPYAFSTRENHRPPPSPLLPTPQNAASVTSCRRCQLPPIRQTSGRRPRLCARNSTKLASASEVLTILRDAHQAQSPRKKTFSSVAELHSNIVTTRHWLNTGSRCNPCETPTSNQTHLAGGIIRSYEDLGRERKAAARLPSAIFLQGYQSNDEFYVLDIEYARCFDVLPHPRRREPALRQKQLEPKSTRTHCPL